MGKAIDIGVSGVARNIKQPSIGVGGVARSVSNGYIGVGGVAREFFSGFGENMIYYYGQTPHTFNIWVNALPDVWDIVHFESDHIAYTEGDYYTDGYGDMDMFVWTNEHSFTLPTLDNYTNLVFLVNTHNKTGTQFGVRFHNNNANSYKNQIYISKSDYTKSDSIREIVIPLTSTHKTRYNDTYNKYGGFRMSLACLYNVSEGEDWYQVFIHKTDIYGIYFT